MADLDREEDDLIAGRGASEAIARDAAAAADNLKSLKATLIEECAALFYSLEGRV